VYGSYYEPINKKNWKRFGSFFLSSCSFISGNVKIKSKSVLQGNNIQEVADWAFRGLGRLERLDLSHNSILTLRKGSLSVQGSTPP
jgi:hypothetical protein